MEDIFNEDYWKQRMLLSTQEHHAIFNCSLAQWQQITAAHEKILDFYIQPKDSVLDVGCAWGRLLKLLPLDWEGLYLGIDLSPDFVMKAREANPDRAFAVKDMQNLTGLPVFDWAILISIRPMIKRNAGIEVWNQIEEQVKAHARKILYLEYDPDDRGATQ